jgi:hypothetical protein
MEIKEQMAAKWDEMDAVEKKRELLFENFEANKDKIAELHYEGEILKLQYMFLKRQQLDQSDRTSRVVAESIDNVKSINETCISLLQKRLIEDGFRERLQRENLI